MAENGAIQVVLNSIEGREFYEEGRSGVYSALQGCKDADMEALYMPELVSNRINSGGESRAWQAWFLAPSVRATGRTKQGTPVVVYAHVPNYFSDLKNIKEVIDSNKLVNRAGIMPKDAFYYLLEQEGNGRVFVVDYERLKRSTSGVIGIDEAIDHPQIVPFLGLGGAGAEKYLARHKKVYGDKIDVWHSDALGEEPVSRLLCLSDYDSGLGGNYDLDGSGRFIGVAPEAQSSVAKGNDPTLEFRVQKLDDNLVRVDGELYVRAPDRLVLSDR